MYSAGDDVSLLVIGGVVQSTNSVKRHRCTECNFHVCMFNYKMPVCIHLLVCVL